MNSADPSSVPPPATPTRAAIFGASGGIGGALLAELAQRAPDCRLYAGSRGETAREEGGVARFGFDMADPESLANAAEAIAADGPLDFVFVATGMLTGQDGTSPEKSLRQITAQGLAEQFAVNAIGPALIARSFLPLLPRDRRAVFAVLSARVGSIGDNRLGGWHGYRAAKAALNMLVRNFAIELARSHPRAIVVGLHPGTVDSALSAPFQRGVPPERLFAPRIAAGHLLDVLDALTPEDSGGLFAWDGARIPF